MTIRQTRRAPWWPALVLVLVRAAWCAPATPKVLAPDAPLPDITVTADLGEHVYSPREEERNAQDVLAFYAKAERLVQDAVLQNRIEAIAHRVITAAARLGPRQVRLDGDPNAVPTFTFRILESRDINAFSAWNGNLFITRGMLDFCQSDDEIAGILAHETAHTMYHHLRDQTRRAQRYQQQQILAMVAAAFMGLNVAQAGVMAQYLYLALLNGHSVEAEAQSDYAGCLYAYRAGYNPVGMITVFERLHRWQMSQPMPVELGAFQTHPWSDQRARALDRQIRALGLPVNRREVTDGLTAQVRLLPGEGGAVRPCLVLGDELLLVVAADQGLSAESRATGLALTLNTALTQGVRSANFTLATGADTARAVALSRLRPLELLTVRAADAQLANTALATFAQTVFNRLLARCRREEIENGAL